MPSSSCFARQCLSATCTDLRVLRLRDALLTCDDNYHTAGQDLNGCHHRLSGEHCFALQSDVIDLSTIDSVDRALTGGDQLYQKRLPHRRVSQVVSRHRKSAQARAFVMQRGKNGKGRDTFDAQEPVCWHVRYYLHTFVGGSASRAIARAAAAPPSSGCTNCSPYDPSTLRSASPAMI
jgi:hypothetical protein